MQTLRNAHRIARFVLVWFALSIGVAIASPLVKPQNTLLVCSANGTLTVQDDPGNDSGGGAAPLPHTLDCPLCAVLGAPPPLPSIEAVPPMGLTYALRDAPDAQVLLRRAAAFAPRGPPAAI